MGTAVGVGVSLTGVGVSATGASVSGCADDTFTVGAGVSTTVIDDARVFGIAEEVAVEAKESKNSPASVLAGVGVGALDSDILRNLRTFPAR